MGFPRGSVSKESDYYMGDLGLIPGLEDPLEKEMATTSLFLPGDFDGQKSLVSYSLWGHREVDMTEWLAFTFFHLVLNNKYIFSE